jgi:hypothetical protein
MGSALLDCVLLLVRRAGARGLGLIDRHRGAGLMSTAVVQPVVPRGLGHLAQPGGVDNGSITSISRSSAALVTARVELILGDHWLQSCATRVACTNKARATAGNNGNALVRC